MEYLHWDEKTITDFSGLAVAGMYERGFVFNRLGKGAMQQTRSCRIDLAKFELSSENRRILKKTDGVAITAVSLPLREEYDYKLGKLAKDFYDTKFGAGTMSANKIKEMLTDERKSNFNQLLTYSIGKTVLGYTICYSGASILHYSYPFYDLATAPKDMGLGMMIRAIEHAKSTGLKYIYLGSLQRPSDTYKLQFSGLEWFDGGPTSSGKWRTDMDQLKIKLTF
jgi:arginyl-tRNA--protein-N-Asp/Glu arginylyltransferase